MTDSAVRVLSELLHRGQTQSSQSIWKKTLNRVLVCALEEIGFANFGLCLVIMKCLIKQRATPAILCGLVKLMCASPKTSMVSWLYHAYATEWGCRQRRARGQTSELPCGTLTELITQRQPHALTLLCQLPMTTKSEVREAFSHFDNYFSPEVVGMFERAFWKRRQSTGAKIFLLSLPINIICSVQQKPLVLPSVCPCHSDLVKASCLDVNCKICCK